MTFKFRKDVNRDIVDKLQAIQYFYQGSKDILVSILTIPSLSINDENFNKFIDKYMNDYVQYELYKMTIEEIYLQQLKIALPNKEYSWMIDYTTSDITITVDLTDDEYSIIENIVKENGFEEERVKE